MRMTITASVFACRAIHCEGGVSNFHTRSCFMKMMYFHVLFDSLRRRRAELYYVQRSNTMQTGHWSSDYVAPVGVRRKKIPAGRRRR